MNFNIEISILHQIWPASTAASLLVSWYQKGLLNRGPRRQNHQLLESYLSQERKICCISLTLILRGSMPGTHRAVQLFLSGMFVLISELLGPTQACTEAICAINKSILALDKFCLLESSLMRLKSNFFNLLWFNDLMSTNERDWSFHIRCHTTSVSGRTLLDWIKKYDVLVFSCLGYISMMIWCDWESQNNFGSMYYKYIESEGILFSPTILVYNFINIFSPFCPCFSRLLWYLSRTYLEYESIVLVVVWIYWRAICWNIYVLIVESLLIFDVIFHPFVSCLSFSMNAKRIKKSCCFSHNYIA